MTDIIEEITKKLFYFYYIGSVIGIIAVVWLFKFQKIVAGVTKKAFVLIDIGIMLNVIGLLILVLQVGEAIPPIAVLHDFVMFVGMIAFLFAAKNLASLVHTNR